MSDTKKCWRQILPNTLDFTRFKYVESIELGGMFYSEELNLNGLNKLKSIRIGDGNFRGKGDLNLVGLKKLESVVIGKNCFRELWDQWYPHFYLKDCPKVRELRIGGGSFLTYTTCIIENVPSLEVIEIDGTDSIMWAVFRSASLELKSILIHSK